MIMITKNIIWFIFIFLLGYILNGIMGIVGSLLFFHNSYIPKLLEWTKQYKIKQYYLKYKDYLTFFSIISLYYFWNIHISYVIIILISFYFVFLAEKAKNN